jgi:superfamily II DNA helicase RecQ
MDIYILYSKLLYNNSLTFNYFRPNIYLELKPGKENLEELDNLVREVKVKKKLTEKTIVFATTPQAASNLFLDFMTKLGTDRSQKTADGEEMFAALFTGATGPVTKKEIVELFMDSKGYLRVLFATSSFGMGVDIPDIRKVIIWGLSCDPVTLLQQIGRAGRDGEPATAVIYSFKTPFYIMNKGDLAIKTDTCIRLQVVRNFVGCEQLVINHSGCTCPGPCACSACYCCSYCKTQCRCRLYPKKNSVLKQVFNFFKLRTK